MAMPGKVELRSNQGASGVGTGCSSPCRRDLRTPAPTPGEGGMSKVPFPLSTETGHRQLRAQPRTPERRGTNRESDTASPVPPEGMGFRDRKLGKRSPAPHQEERKRRASMPLSLALYRCASRTGKGTIWGGK
jgi:hypothetical protein